MKSLISMISAAALAAVASLAPIAQAQSTPISIRANVPFAFDYGTKHLPAGTYIFSFTDDLVTVSGASGTFIGWAKMAYDPGRVNETRVIFHRYGDYYFLDGLTINGGGAQIHCCPKHILS